MSLDYYRRRRTLAEPVRLRGTGLHSGEETGVTFHPAEAGSGISVTTGELETARPLADLTIDDESIRGTNLLIDEQLVWTVEHAAAALYGLGITDLIVQMDGAELPALDGSSREYVRAFREAGLDELDAERELYRIDEPVHVESGASLLSVYPASEPSFDVSITYPDRSIDDQVYRWEPDPERFPEDLAAARTFGFEDEAETLREQGLARGAGLENTLVFNDGGLHEDQSLRMEREPARHKTLDLLGDLALAGEFVVGRVVAHRSGHSLNHRIVDHLREKTKKLPDRKVREGRRTGGVIPADRIRGILPHRYPFLLLDKILHIDHENQTASALKNVTMNEEFFQGHFPDDPIMPGVLMLEAIAQLGGACILDRPENDGKNTYFMGVDDVKFRNPVRPGDRLVLEVKGRRIGSRSGMMDGYAYANGTLATEGLFKFMLVENGDRP